MGTALFLPRGKCCKHMPKPIKQYNDFSKIQCIDCLNLDFYDTCKAHTVIDHRNHFHVINFKIKFTIKEFNPKP